MKTLKLDSSFEIDTSTDATVRVYDHAGEEIGYVKFTFVHAHKVEIHLPTEPYYVQTAVADEAAYLLDSRFNDDLEPYDEKTVDL